MNRSHVCFEVMALALTAYATEKPVVIEYHDGFGPGSECRLTYLALKH